MGQNLARSSLVVPTSNFFRKSVMSRPITLFTGQWADLPLAKLAPKIASFGYDGAELACWGDHFDVNAATGVSLEDFIGGRRPDPQSGASYRRDKWLQLADNGLNCYAISAHLVGQAICDLIDPRHKEILPPSVWGKGVSCYPGQIGYDAQEAENIRRRAAAQLQLTAIAARYFMDDKPEALRGGSDYGIAPAVVNGFTGSSIWGLQYAFPPTTQEVWDQGFSDFANRFNPILNVFEQQNVNFALEVHPTEIAFDTATARRAVAAVKGHKRFGFNFDPSHLLYQRVNYRKFIYTFADRIFHVHDKDVQCGCALDGEVGVFGGFTDFANPARDWDFRSIGHGQVNFDAITCALNDIGYLGSRSVEWEDSRMEREFGATEACAAIKKIEFKPSGIAFDGQFNN